MAFELSLKNNKKLGLGKNSSGKIISLDIGSKNVKIVKGNINKKGGVTVSNCIIEPTPDACIENGYIKNQSDLGVFLRSVISKYNLNKYNCYLSVKSSDIISREIEVPVIKEPKLTKVIKNEISNVFVNSSDFYIDYLISETKVIDYKNIYKILAYAVPKNMVYSYYELISSCDIKPIVFDVHRNSIHKIFKKDVLLNQTPISDKVMILVDIGGTYMELDLIIDGNSIFKRSILIEDELEMNDNFSVSSFTEYETIPDANEYEAYINSGVNSFLYDDINSISNVNISPLFSKINEEVYKMMQFSVSRQGNRPVTDLYLYGGNSRLPGLDSYLSSSLEINVERIFNVSNIELNVEEDVSDILVACGSFIRL